MAKKPLFPGETVKKTSISLPERDRRFLSDLAVELFVLTGGGVGELIRGEERPSASSVVRAMIWRERRSRTVNGWQWFVDQTPHNRLGLTVVWENLETGDKVFQVLKDRLPPDMPLQVKAAGPERPGLPESLRGLVTPTGKKRFVTTADLDAWANAGPLEPVAAKKVKQKAAPRKKATSMKPAKKRTAKKTTR